MPLYEYFCGNCEGIFELLRPASAASHDQPCPQCDNDAKRIISHEFSAFIFRDGSPRRLPDDGGYMHLGKKVKNMITSSTDAYSHPELNPEPPPAPPSIEEIELYEAQQIQKNEIDPEFRGRVIDDAYRREQDIKKRMRQTRGSRVEEHAKRRAITVERAIAKENPPA